MTEDRMTIPPEPTRPDVSSGARQRSVTLMAAIALLVVALIAVGLMVVSGDDDQPSSIQTAGEIYLQPVSDPGPDAFSDDVEDLVPNGETPLIPAGASVDTSSSTAPSDAPVATTARTGTEPGLYGGSRDDAVCDPMAIVAFLDANPDKGAAWAAVHGIEASEIAQFVATLTPVVLLEDTRVTNHGFRDGQANGFQSVLQAGTSVLVDPTGVPRARCACGNPLLPPVAQTGQATYTGEPWDTFEPTRTAVVTAGAAVDTFVLTDLSSLDQGRVPDADDRVVFERPSGSAGAAEVGITVESNDGPTTTTTTESPATTTSTTEARVQQDVTALGRVTASSVYSDQFAVGLAVDGSAGSSWFSAGGGTATYTWAVDQPVDVTTVAIISNAAHDFPDFRTGFGFEAVTVRLLLAGEEIASFDYALPGTPDPDVVVELGDPIAADQIVLDFSGGEDPTCGGFSELRIEALR